MISGVQCCISKLDEKTVIKEICELVISIALEKCKKECGTCLNYSGTRFLSTES